MTDQAEPGRQPADEAAAFDVRKRSPEQIAQLLVRWKEQRKRPQQRTRAGQPSDPRPEPATVLGAAQDSPPVSEDVTDRDPERGPLQKPRPIQYSTLFAALLAAGSEPTVAHRIWYPGTGLPRLRRPHPSRGRPKVTWVLTGAASVVAVAAMASGALLELSEWRSPSEAKPRAAQVHPLDIPMAEPFVATATASRAGEWTLQQTIDRALMKAAPLMPRSKPSAPVVQTAHKAAAAPKSAPAAQPLSEPKLESAAPEVLSFVPKPFVPSVAPAIANSRAAAAAVGLNGDPRPDALVQRGHDQRNSTVGANNRVGASGSKPAGAAGSGGSVDPRSASSRGGGAATGGTGDPGSGGTGGGGEGDGSGAVGDTGRDSGGGASTGDSGGEAGDGNAGGGNTGGDAGGGDSGGGDAGGGGGSGGDAGGANAGGGDNGGGSGGGDTGDGDSGGGDSGSGGGQDGESGGVGGAPGGDTGSDSAGGESKDKDKDKSD